MDDRSLDLIEFFQVTAAVADRAESDGARQALLKWRPMADRAEREVEIERLREAIRCTDEPGEWCFVGPGSLREVFEREAVEGLDGRGLVEVRRWLDAATAAVAAWDDPARQKRFPRLAARVAELRQPRGLREQLTAALDDDGAVQDAASPLLRRLRRELTEGERRLGVQLERWAQRFGAEAYVTRHVDRFVAMVPADSFPRRRGIVHDVSNSGRSLLVEPLESCGENNRLIELRAAAALEERRVLGELAAAVAAGHGMLVDLEATLIHLDTLRARARWARVLGAVALTPGGDHLRLRTARHPLLAARAGANQAVIPLDLELGLGAGGRLLIVSGPNMGGKTVLLKTVGLALALSHAAFPVPAGEDSTLPEIRDLMVDLGDPQSLEEGLSSFAAHLAVLARMADAAGPMAVLLCDELGAGTDPEEGGALARALVEHFARRGAWGVVTTHLTTLKRLSGEVPGLVNGSLEFDLKTLTPRFRFLGGVPGASHALAVAERLGFPAALLGRARALTPESTQLLERLTADMAEAVRRHRDEAAALEQARIDATAEAERHREAVESSRRELAAERRRLTRESEAVLARARELWQTMQREARREARARNEPADLKAEMTRIERATEDLSGGPDAEPRDLAPLRAEELAPGRWVRVIDLGVEAQVASGPDAEGRVQLRRGGFTIQSRVGRLAAGRGGPATTQPLNGQWSVPEEAPPIQVDLRGLEADEALAQLDRGLDRAMLAGLAELRVVHGIGRGVLRAAVERHLRSHPQVAEQRLGRVGEGGRGVTVARLC
ncbi:MAG TPA: Smr/MutS family protein [Candidatus Eisenbacteria bacterium]